MKSYASQVTIGVVSKFSVGGGEFEKMQIEEEILVVASNEKSLELLALDEALENLAKIDPQKSKIVELRYFGGLSVEETAEVLGVSEITVKRHWRMAKAWLYGQLAQVQQKD